jgi:hypothetical protein
VRTIRNGDRIRIRLLDTGEVFEAIRDMHLDSELPIQITQCDGEGKTLILSDGEYEISRLDD